MGMTLEDYNRRSKLEFETKDVTMLSILIPTLPERGKMYAKLRWNLDNQITKTKEVHPVLGNVEVLIDRRVKYKNGGPSIGQKRQELLEKATGMYVCFLDDDESIAPNYVESILRLIFERPDIGTFSSISKLESFWCVVVMRLKTPENQQAFPGIVQRKPWHICPVRREIALRHKFPESNYGEDWVWFDNVLKECTVENNTTAIIHQYNHNTLVSQADNLTTSIG